MYGYPLAVVVVMVASLTLLLVHLGNTSSEERDDDDYPSSTAAARDWRIRMAAFVSFVRIMCRWRWRAADGSYPCRNSYASNYLYVATYILILILGGGGVVPLSIALVYLK